MRCYWSIGHVMLVINLWCIRCMMRLYRTIYTIMVLNVALQCTIKYVDLSDAARAAIVSLKPTAFLSFHLNYYYRPFSIYRRVPTLLQLQHLLQYQRSLPTSVTVITLASVAVMMTIMKSFHIFRFIQFIDHQLQLIATINVIFTACYQYCSLSALSKFYSVLTYDACLQSIELYYVLCMTQTCVNSFDHTWSYVSDQ